MLFKGIIAVYNENYMKYMNTFCGQNVELMNVKVSCTALTGVLLKG
jgi:hypothetical protein